MADKPIVSLEGMSDEEIKGVASSFKGLLDNPATRKEALRLLKKQNPELSVPELEIEETVAKSTASLEKRVEEMTNKLAEKEARERLNEMRMSPVKKGYCSEADLPDLEKYMKDNGFAMTQYEQAARLRKSERALAEPTPSVFKESASLLPTGDKMKEWLANPKKMARQEAMAAIDELKAKH